MALFNPVNQKICTSHWGCVAFHDLAGAGLPEQAASGASQPVLWPVLILRVGLRYFLLRRRPPKRQTEDPA
jgi:hypothetical protein